MHGRRPVHAERSPSGRRPRHDGRSSRVRRPVCAKARTGGRSLSNRRPERDEVRMAEGLHVRCEACVSEVRGTRPAREGETCRTNGPGEPSRGRAKPARPKACARDAKPARPVQTLRQDPQGMLCPAREFAKAQRAKAKARTSSRASTRVDFSSTRVQAKPVLAGRPARSSGARRLVILIRSLRRGDEARVSACVANFVHVRRLTLVRTVFPVKRAFSLTRLASLPCRRSSCENN